MTDLKIRALRAGDATQWRQLWTAYLAFYESSVSEEVYETTFARLLGDDPQDFSGLVAEKDGELIGLTHYLFHRHGWKIENTCYLQDLFVAPTARNTGAGRALIQGVYDEARKHSVSTVYWLTQDFNHTARKLYDSLARETPFIKYQWP